MLLIRLLVKNALLNFIARVLFANLRLATVHATMNFGSFEYIEAFVKFIKS